MSTIVGIPLSAKRVVVEIRDLDTLQVIREFLEPLGYTVESEPEPGTTSSDSLTSSAHS
jgi:hypothetical protein